MKFKHDIEAEAGFKDKDGQLGSAGQILSSTGTQTDWIDQSTIASGSAEVVEVPVKNLMGSTLKKGDPVYISGSVGASGRLEVKLADASDSNKMPAVGLLKQDLVSNEEGFVVVTGKLRNLITSPIDGATPNPNDVIYVKPNGTAGAALTLTKPTGSSNLIQNMGKVGRVSTSNDGTFIVSSILRSNDIPNLSTGKIWVGDGNTVESTVVHLDETNGRMGIGTSSPTNALDVYGNIRLGTTGDFFIYQSPFVTNTFYARTVTSGTLTFGAPASFQQNVSAQGDLYAAGGSSSTAIGTKRFGTWSNKIVDTGNNYFNLQGGNFGIGTTSPSSKLQVFGDLTVGDDGLVGSWINVIAAGSGQDAGIRFGSESNTDSKAAIYTNTSNSDLHFDVTETTRMLIDSATGNVGIGETNPAQKLHVIGNSEITGDIFLGRYIFHNDDTNTWLGFPLADTISFRTNGSDRMYINSSGNVGIGTTSPSQKLDVAGDATFDGRIYTNATALASVGILGKAIANGWAARYDSNNANYSGFYFDANNDASMILRDDAGNMNVYLRSDSTSYLNGGNVGIGTTNPQRKFHVNGIARIEANAQTLDLVGTDHTFIGFYPDGISAGRKAYIGFPGSASNRLTIANEFNDDISFFTNGSEKVTIENSGDVGIGTTSPSYKLDISGDLRVDNGNIGSTSGDELTHARIQGARHFLDFKEIRTANDWDWKNTTFKIQTGVDATKHQSIDFVSDNNYREHIDILTGNQVFNTRFTYDGKVGIGTTSPNEKLEVSGTVKATAATDAYKGYIKSVITTGYSMKSASTAYQYISYNSYTLTTSPAYYNRTVAAYNGRVKKIIVKRIDGASADATGMKFKKEVNGTVSATEYTATVLYGSGNFQATYNFANSDFTFSAGDSIGVLMQSSGGTGMIGAGAIQIVLEYNIT